MNKIKGEKWQDLPKSIWQVALIPNDQDEALVSSVPKNRNAVDYSAQRTAMTKNNMLGMDPETWLKLIKASDDAAVDSI